MHTATGNKTEEDKQVHGHQIDMTPTTDLEVIPVQKKRTHITRPSTQTELLETADSPLTSALGVIPT